MKSRWLKSGCKFLFSGPCGKKFIVSKFSRSCSVVMSLLPLKQFRSKLQKKRLRIRRSLEPSEEYLSPFDYVCLELLDWAERLFPSECSPEWLCSLLMMISSTCSVSGCSAPSS